MAKKKRLNEYDENPSKVIKKTYRKKKRVRRMRVLMIILLISAIGYYFYSPYSKLQSISISGNQVVSTEEIKAVLGYNEQSIRLFTFSNTIKKNVGALPVIKNVKVSKSLFHGLTVKVEESEPIAYFEKENIVTVVFDDGNIKDTNDQEIIKKAKALSQLCDFNDEEVLKEFAVQWAQVDPGVRLQISDILYEPLESDPLRIKLLGDNNKQSYVRIEDMVYQLEYYNNVVNEDSKNCYFDFLGGHVYKRTCD